MKETQETPTSAAFITQVQGKIVTVQGEIFYEQKDYGVMSFFSLEGPLRSLVPLAKSINDAAIDAGLTCKEQTGETQMQGTWWAHLHVWQPRMLDAWRALKQLLGPMKPRAIAHKDKKQVNIWIESTHVTPAVLQQLESNPLVTYKTGTDFDHVIVPLGLVHMPDAWK